MKLGIFDIETDGLLPNVSKVHCATVLDHDTEELRSFTPEDIDQLCAYLDTFDVLIGHNVIYYDFPVLRLIFGYEFKGKVVDTLIMSRTQRPNRISPRGCKAGPHSVEAWGFRLGHAKVEHEDWENYSPAMLHRNREDVLIQKQIYDELLEEGRGEGWMKAHRLNNNLFRYLQLQEEYGWAVDEEHLDYCIATLKRWMQRVKDVLEHKLPLHVEVDEGKRDGEYNWVRKPFKKDGSRAKVVHDWIANLGPDSGYVAEDVGGPFTRIHFRRLDLDKNAEVKDFLLKQGWQPAAWNQNKEGKRTSPKLSHEDEFEGIQGSMGRLIAKRIQCKQRLGVVEGWKHAIQYDANGVPRIHGGNSGLASTARLKHKLIVNVPSPEKESFFAVWMRKVFTASPGKVMIGVDSAGNQMRQLAARMRMTGNPDEEFEYALLHGDKADGSDMHSVNMRRTGLPTRGHAKNFFYGLIFGAGDWKTGQLVQGGAQEGAAIKEQYFSEMPGIRQTIEVLTAQWRNTAQRYFDPKFNRMVYRNGYIKGIDGRPVLVESEHAILCYALQSDEAIQMAVAYVMMHKWMEERGYKLHEDWAMLYWGHDEFQMESRPEMAQEVLELACEAIRWSGEFLKIPFPHAGDGSIGANWHDCH